MPLPRGFENTLSLIFSGASILADTLADVLVVETRPEKKLKLNWAILKVVAI